MPNERRPHPKPPPSKGYEIIEKGSKQPPKPPPPPKSQDRPPSPKGKS